jgi:hypothetical protein
MRACALLEAEAREQAEAERPTYAANKTAYDAKQGRRGRPPTPAEDDPPPTRQTNLTDPGSALLQRPRRTHHRRPAAPAEAKPALGEPFVEGHPDVASRIILIKRRYRNSLQHASRNFFRYCHSW